MYNYLFQFEVERFDLINGDLVAMLLVLLYFIIFKGKYATARTLP